MLNQIINRIADTPPGAGIGVVRRIESKKATEYINNNKVHWVFSPLGGAPDGVLHLEDRMISIPKLYRGRLTPLYTIPVEYRNQTEAMLLKTDADDVPEFVTDEYLAGHQMQELVNAYPRIQDIGIKHISCFNGVSEEIVVSIETRLFPNVPPNLVEYGKRLAMLDVALQPAHFGREPKGADSLPVDLKELIKMEAKHKALCLRLVQELKDAVQDAWVYANSYIDGAEREQMNASNGQPGKSQLNANDYFYYAMTNRIPAHGDKVVVSTPQGARDSSVQVSAMGKKECPECAELIMEKASVCRFCQYRFPAPVPSKPAKGASKAEVKDDQQEVAE